ncbi:CHAT domain-containing tetratricopeptide repeat protein [Nocardia sp. NPDC052001]|uniref:CHAT domain-containing protein n=1 Tax=Nocardia sp. NPDC052001 TaxID=3154853 RepID=UPI00341490EF
MATNQFGGCMWFDEPNGRKLATSLDKHPDYAIHLANLSIAYGSQYERTGAAIDLDYAISYGGQAVAATPLGHPYRAIYLNNLGHVCRLRFERAGVAADLHHAIAVLDHAVAAAPSGHPVQAAALSNLGLAYQRRFELAGAMADLDNAIRMCQQSVDTTPTDHPYRAKYLSNLGLAQLWRFERTAVTTDLDSAIVLLEQAVAIDHFNPAPILSNLGIAYQRRFERAHVKADLDRAIEVLTTAVDATSTQQPNYAMYVSNLGLTYQSRFQRTGVTADLDRAISIFGQAVASAPADHPDRAMYLANLGIAHRLRAGLADDLDHAVGVLEMAADTTPADHPNRAMHLGNLGITYLSRFERTGAAGDLDRAIDITEQAVVATPADHPNRAMYLGNLGIIHCSRFEHTGEATDLDHAIHIGQQAVDATPTDHPNRARHLSNLGTAYRLRFVYVTDATSDLDRAIDTAEQAVDATSTDHPSRAKYLANLSIAYLLRLSSDRHGADRMTVSMLATGLAMAGSAPVADQVRAGHVIGLLAQAVNDHALAVEVLDAAVALVPLVALRELGWEDQEYGLGLHYGLVSEAVAAHCAIGDPTGAVEVAELGRGVLLAAQLDIRTDLTDLDRALPHLAAPLRRVRELLNTPHATVDQLAISSPGRNDDRKRHGAVHDELLTQIRQHRGFDRFLLPPRLIDLQPKLAGGTVIMINSGRQRSDAIVLIEDAAPLLIQLPDLARGDVDTHAQAFLEASYDGGLAGILRRQRIISETLTWLWETIVHPILNAAPLHHSDGSLPRVWWQPTGLLGLFPLHAAGQPGQPGALDAVISSYIPTLRALTHFRTRPPATARRQLTVALHHTPGLPDLSGTVAEAATLHTQHPDMPLLLNETASTDRVLAALPRATWAHFSCHAGIDFTAPSRSGLHLHDGTLALPQISRLQLPHAELAYLSACSTAHPGSRHIDESLHPASAFHLAGFRHVIASLWPLADHIAATAATTFYQHLPPTPTADHAATALHRTTCALRAQYPSRPDLWGALIHSGP